MVRSPFFDKNGVKKGAWSQEEDDKLRAYVEEHGQHCNWRELPKYAGLSRCGKSCRLRWVNYLRPGVKLGNYSREEEDLIVKLHEQLGNKWSKIAAELPGRTDNEIKNYWHTHLKKRTKKAQISESMEESTEIISYDSSVENSFKYPILESHPLSPASPSNELSHSTSNSAMVTMPSTSSNCLPENNRFSYEAFENNSGDDFWTKPFVPDQDYYQMPSPDCRLISSDVTSYKDSADFLDEVMRELPRI